MTALPAPPQWVIHKMTEPEVASSDATNIRTSIKREGNEWVINGRKWFITNAGDPRCKILIVMGRTNPEAASHQQQSMVLVPIDTPGVTVVRSTSVFGYQDQPGHCEIIYDHRAYTLCDRSRQGTLVNDQPVKRQTALHSGDWIRLGPSGPVVYFLGQPNKVEGGVVG